MKKTDIVIPNIQSEFAKSDTALTRTISNGVDAKKSMNEESESTQATVKS